MLVSRSYRICSANGRTADGTGLRFLYDQVSGRWLFTATGPSTPNASVSPTTIPVEVRIGDDWGTTNLKFTKTFGIWIGRPS